MQDRTSEVNSRIEFSTDVCGRLALNGSKQLEPPALPKSVVC